jgi:hypothetical protein
MFKLLLALALTCLGLTATAEELCATKDTAAYAAHPNQGPKSPAKLKVVKGRSYSVAPRIDGWVGVQSGGEFGWAPESAFSRCMSKNASSNASSLAGVTAGAQDPPSSERPSSAKSSSEASRKTASAGPSVAGCPCGSGKVCVGPRGGRYCITSGGNKRYGV